MARGLSNQQNLFIKYYVETENAQKAAVLAGYRKDNVETFARKNLQNPRVLREIEALQRERAEERNKAANADAVRVRLTDIIAPAFYSVHWDVIEGGHTLSLIHI